MKPNRIETLDRASLIYYAIPLVISLIALSFSYLFYSNDERLRAAEEERYKAYLLSEQLRQSSDQLTSMARAYVATGDYRYRDFFETILLIRDGRHPRPLHYNRAYWELLLPEGGQPPYPNSIAKPFQQLLQESGFAASELDLLARAQKASDNLALIETEAFFAMEGIFKDEDGHYNIHRVPDRQFATDLLHSEAYLKARARIMALINQFYEQQANRSNNRVSQLHAKHRFFSNATLISFLVLLVAIVLINLRRFREQRLLLNFLEDEVQQRTEQLHKQNDELRDVIDHLNEAREQLVESEKMSALGRMVAGFAHEINTPIGIGVTAASSISSQSRKLQKEQEQGTLSVETFSSGLERMHEGADLILKNMERAAELVTSFKQIAVDQSIEQRRQIDLHDYLDEVIISIKPRFKHQNIRIDNRVPAQQLIEINPGAIAQVITNLIVNACMHAFDESGGEILIESIEQPEYFELHFRDNGRGMSAEVLNNIYAPFFTTKRNRGGTGLGMHIVHNLITDKLGGTINCVSAPNQGTHFTLTLPKHPPGERLNITGGGEN